MLQATLADNYPDPQHITLLGTFIKISWDSSEGLMDWRSPGNFLLGGVMLNLYLAFFE